MKAGILSDFHFCTAENTCDTGRRGEIADHLLNVAITELKKYTPDILLVLGDLVNVPSDMESLKTIADILKKIDLPMIVLPGNHDPAPEQFYTLIPRPPEHLDIKNYRLVPYCDEQTAGWNARRSAADIARQKYHRQAFSGKIISLQHVPLFEPGCAHSPFSYDNMDEVVDGSFDFSVSGHLHWGFSGICGKQMRAWTVPALCESPFRFGLWDFDTDSVSIFALENKNTKF